MPCVNTRLGRQVVLLGCKGDAKSLSFARELTPVGSDALETDYGYADCRGVGTLELG